MQKAFYQKTFNIIRYLSIYAILSIVLSFTFHILIFLLNNEIFSKRVTIIQSKLHLISMLLLLIGILLFMLLSTLLIIELIDRYKTDKISNYIESVKQTMRLRYFLIQHEASSPSANSFQRNQILRDFNKSLSNCIVDVRNESVIVALKYPASQQSQQIFRNMESHVKEEISNYNPKFYFHLQRELEIDCFTKVQKDSENRVFDTRSECQTHSIFQKYLFLLGLLRQPPIE
ncbi:hypothetical protein [Streptococcus sp. 151470009-6]